MRLFNDVYPKIITRRCRGFSAQLKRANHPDKKDVMLELRPTCEHCNKALAPNSLEARICTYECTFCARV